MDVAETMLEDVVGHFIDFKGQIIKAAVQLVFIGLFGFAYCSKQDNEVSGEAQWETENEDEDGELPALSDFNLNDVSKKEKKIFLKLISQVQKNQKNLEKLNKEILKYANDKAGPPKPLT